MKITYDPEVDARSIQLRADEVADSLHLEPGVTADLDADGHVAGIEVLDARERLGSEAITSISLEQLLATPH